MGALPVLHDLCRDETEPLPTLYAEWMSECVPSGIPKERRATCNNCAMTQDFVEGGANTRSFHPTLKCCTYLPNLPNFLVGAVLAKDQTELGVRSVKERILRRSGVTPLGLGTNAGYSMLYGEAGGEAFGRSPALLCPHFLVDAGQCGIWEHRNAVCSTYFCKHDRGLVGAEFWSDVKTLLARIELELSWWCVQQQDGISATQLRQLRSEASLAANKKLWKELTGAELGIFYSEIWGQWIDREEEFFRGCAALVAGLSWDEVLSLCGPQAMSDRLILREAVAKSQLRELPSRLSQATKGVDAAEDGNYRLTTYSGQDPLVVDAHILPALRFFDGRLTSDALAECKAVGLDLTSETVQALCDWGVLREDSGAQTPATDQGARLRP